MDRPCLKFRTLIPEQGGTCILVFRKGEQGQEQAIPAALERLAVRYDVATTPRWGRASTLKDERKPKRDEHSEESVNASLNLPRPPVEDSPPR